MRVWKLKPNETEYWSMERDVYERLTKKFKPYYRISKGGEEVHYAVCPKCDNPIQIIGLYKKIKNTDKPYARHIPNDVEGVAEYNQEAYDFCPLRERTHYVRSDRKKNIKGLPTEILRLLKEQFDRVVYILSNDTDIRFSEKLLRSMLKTYFAEQGYLYVGATLDNLPWIFAYMSNAQPLLGQQIRRDSPLHKAIRKSCPEADFKETYGDKYVILTRKANSFVDISFSFIVHKVITDGQEMKESIELGVYVGNNPPKTIFEKVIHMDTDHFLHLVNLSPDKSKRNQKQLDIVNEIIMERAEGRIIENK